MSRAAQSRPPLPLLTRASDIRRLTLEQANRGYPVLIHGVVTYYAPAMPHPHLPGDVMDPDLFVQDASGGIWVGIPKTSPPFHAGQAVEVQGVTEEPDFAPQIGQARVRVTGEAPLPKPHRVTIERMFSTAEDSQWVQIEGVVRRVEIARGALQLEIAVAGGRLQAQIPSFHQPVPDHLVDAEVRVRGICGALFSKTLQLLGIILYVPDLRQIEVVRAAPANPYDAPLQPIPSLQRFTIRRSLSHRIRVQGSVTFSDGGRTVYICDGANGIRIDMAQPVNFHAGDRLDVVGFVRIANLSLHIEDAVCRRLGFDPPPAPVPVTAAQILSGEYDSRLVWLEGTVLGESGSAALQTLLLKNGSILYEASFRQSRKGALPPVGSVVQLNGICDVTRDDSQHNESFGILLDSLDDVTVVQRPPFWTAGRALAALGLLAALVLAALGWIHSLRRQVRAQIALIRRRLEREAALEQRFQNLLQHANDIVVTADAQGLITSLNKAGEEISGYRQDEVLGTHMAALFGSQREEVAEALERIVRGEACPVREWNIAGKSGHRTLVEVSLQAIWEGGPASILGVARDITDRKRAEAEILRARKLALAKDAAEEASRAKSAFLANMSHELRTPLNAVIGYSQMLQESAEGVDPEELRGDLAKIERAGHILLGIINDILDLAKVESGRERVRCENVDLPTLLQDVVQSVDPLARNQGNVLRVECPAEARLAYADVTKLRQSVLNLVNNACKFTENGQVSVTVDRSCNGNGDWTRIAVRDTGIGIRAEDLDKLFQPFSQLDGPAKRKHAGTGLGLAISRKFCRMMGGDITVESEPGRGSCFTIRVPAPAPAPASVKG